MYCNHCGHPHAGPDRFCINCGAALEKKGRHWVPLLIMAVLAVCCSVLFYLIPMEAGEPATRLTDREMPWFSLENGVLYFDETAYTGSDELVIPSQISGAAVIAISDGCFRDCDELTAVYLPQTLEAIGENAFEGCTDLRGMEVPESVAFIGKSAFAHCSGLEAICLSGKLRYIGDGAFDGCGGLRYVYFLGDFAQWAALYPDFIAPEVIISCDDGKFYQSGDPC